MNLEMDSETEFEIHAVVSGKKLSGSAIYVIHNCLSHTKEI